MQHLSRRFAGFVFLYVVIALIVYTVLFNLASFFPFRFMARDVTLFFRLVIFLPPIIFIAVKRYPFAGTLRLNTFSGKQLLFAVGLSIFIYLFIHTFGSMLENLFYGLFHPNFQLGYFHEGGFVLWPDVLTSCLIPAIFYELTFRGAVQSGFRNISSLKACLFVGVLFGLFQLNVLEFLQYAVYGFVLCYISNKTGSIIPGMLTFFLVLLFRFINLDGWLYFSILSSIGISEGLIAFIMAFISIFVVGILLWKMPDTSNTSRPIGRPKIGQFLKKLLELRRKFQQSFMSGDYESESNTGDERPAINVPADPVVSKEEIYPNSDPKQNKNTGFIIGGIILAALTLLQFGFSIYNLLLLLKGL